MSYDSLSAEFITTDHPSPRYWLLWPGIMCMIAVSFTGKTRTSILATTIFLLTISIELACQWRIFFLSGKFLYKSASRVFARIFKSKKQLYLDTEEDAEVDSNFVADPSPPSEQVKLWMWLPGLIGLVLMTCIVMKQQFEMPVGEILLALALAVFFSFLSIQSTGATGKPPYSINSCKFNVA